MNAKKAIELGFADAILTDEKRATTDDAYAFSSKAVEQALMNRISAKAESRPKHTHEGRSVDELKARLKTIKNYL